MNIIQPHAHYFKAPIDIKAQSQRLARYCTYETLGDYTVYAGQETFAMRWTCVDYAGASKRDMAAKMVSASLGNLPRRGTIFHFDVTEIYERYPERLGWDKAIQRLVEIVDEHNGLMVINTIRSEGMLDQPLAFASIGFKTPRAAMVWKLAYL